MNVGFLAFTVAVAFGNYQIKYDSQVKQSELSKIENRISAELQGIKVARAEWSYLTQPDRLQALASQHLDLDPVNPGQIVDESQVAIRIPIIFDASLARKSNRIIIDGGSSEVRLGAANDGQ
jgi:cell division protein FtsL